MKHVIFSLLALVLAESAAAASTFQTGSQTLHINDPEPVLIEALGQPTHKVSVDDSKGDHLGDYYYYTVGKLTVRFLIAKDRITEIYEMRP